MKRLLAGLLCCLLLSSVVWGASAAIRKTPSLSAQRLSLTVGKTKTLKVKQNGVWKLAKTSWKSNKPSVLRVTQKGKLTGRKAGQAVITATVKAKPTKTAKEKTYRLTCKVTVRPKKKKEATDMKLSINGTELIVAWEDNESVKALRSLAAEGPLTVSLSRYGGFEQVGSLGTTLPTNDVQTTTEPGDIVLYSGNQIVIFYGSNSWAYTRLGHIQRLSNRELVELLGGADAKLVLW